MPCKCSHAESKPRNWLSEADVEFFTGGGPSEISEGDATSSKEESEEIRRRILIGLGITAAVGAFALIPTEKLQPPPSKPLFFYLVPLLRVEKLLTEAESVIPEGDYQALKTILARIEGPPNNVQDNLRQAAACKLNAIITSRLLSRAPLLKDNSVSHLDVPSYFSNTKNIFPQTLCSSYEFKASGGC